MLINPYMVTPPAPAWTPASLANIVAWWNPRTLAYANLSSVTTWVDVTGSKTATGVPPIRAPLMQLNSGDPYVDFTNGGRDMDTDILNAFNSFSVVAVVDFTSLASAARLFDKDFTNGFWCGPEPGPGGNIGGGIRQPSPPYGHYVAATTGVKRAFLFQRNNAIGHKDIWFGTNHSNTTGITSTALNTAALTFGKSGGGSGAYKLWDVIVTSGTVMTSGVLDTNLAAWLLSQHGVSF